MGIINSIRNWWTQDNLFSSRNSYLLGQQGAIWIDTTKPRILFDTIPQLNMVIRKDANMFSNMELIHVDKNGKIIENSEFVRLLNSPNTLQSLNEFLIEYRMQLLLYGNQFIYKNSPSVLNRIPISLWNISANYIQPELSGKVFDQTSKDGIITKYKYSLNNYEREFDVKSILWNKTVDVDNPIIGCSPVQSLKYPLSNIEASYKYRNVIMTRKGAIGMLSNEGKDSMGSVPLKKEEKKKIEDEHINKYGLNADQSTIILTESSLKWTPMSYPTRELMLFEEVDADMITICDAYGHNINIYSTRSSTFENVKNSIIQTYQDTIIPGADQFTQSLTKFLNMQNGERLIASYEHLSIMKETKLKGMASIESIVSSLTEAVSAGLLTPAQAKVILQNELNLTASV